MHESLFSLVVLPLGLGLLGFIEPCSVGTSLLFLQYLEGRPPATRVAGTLIFTVTRAVFIGLLGIIAVLVGSAFVDFQKGAWAVMGALYSIFRRVPARCSWHFSARQRSAAPATWPADS